MPYKTIVVYSSADSRSAELIKKYIPNAELKLIEPTIDPESNPLDTYLNHNILLGLELANPYVKKYFPNLKVNYDTETISGYPEVSPDGKYIVKSITTLSYRITVVGGFSEEDTWRATHQFLGIVYIPPLPTGYYKWGTLIIDYVKYDLTKSDYDIVKDITDQVAEELSYQDAKVQNPTYYQTGKLYGLFPTYEYTCEIWTKGSPFFFEFIIALLIVGIVILGYKAYEAQIIRDQATISSNQLKEKLLEAQQKYEVCSEGYHNIQKLLEQTSENVTDGDQPQDWTKWIEKIFNWLPLILIFVLLMSLLGAIPRGRD